MIINMTDKTVREKYARQFESLYDAFVKENDGIPYIEWFERVTNGSVTIHNPTPGTLCEIEHIVFDYEIEHITFDDDRDYQRFLLTWG
jgi:hypothetical protein